MPVFGYKTEKDADVPLAKEALDILVTCYPGHAWFVDIKGGVLQVKNLSFSSQWGMVHKLGDIFQDAMVRKRSIVMAAGEFLERAELRRGRYREIPAVHVEGIPQKDFGR